MARLEVYLPGNGSFNFDFRDDVALADIAIAISRGFVDEGGIWLSFASDDLETPDHHRWIPVTAGVAFIWDSPFGADALPALRVVG